MSKDNKLVDYLIPISLIASLGGVIFYKKNMKIKKQKSTKELINRTQLLAVDYSNENVEDFISYAKDKNLNVKEMACMIEAYHMLINYEVDPKYINDIKLILEMNGYINPFKYKSIE
ncbi:hypothetical protein [Oceanirhabdus sp. W0125-5]|uniref:hypothetical protein n=1 Tax=Oceanirhabdus sp. W0125-5 TaxID=2999116 RepID=UPI0022F2FB2B|nr:hypothetical protein [Oceanirhabdus sp. W0125-5]WBW95137.1 hypothetical protein OW730_15750 [Oceanirhabdus sp. W0125-5]